MLAASILVTSQIRQNVARLSDGDRKKCPIQVHRHRYAATRSGMVCRWRCHSFLPVCLLVMVSHPYFNRCSQRFLREYEIVYEDGVCILRINEAMAEDEGEYSCEAKNSAGKAVTKCYLKVLSKFFSFYYNMLFLNGNSKWTLSNDISRAKITK